MVFKRRRVTRKRTLVKKRGVRRNRTVIQRGFSIGMSQLVRFKYAQQIAIDPAATEARGYVFRASSPFQPDFTGTSGTAHQPMGWDQWTVFYNRYIVVRSKCRFSVIPTESIALGTGAGIITIMVSDSSATTTTIETQIEDGKSKYKLFGTLGSNPVTVRHTYDVKKHVGIKDYKDQAGGSYGAQFDASPSDAWYFLCHYGCIQDAADALVQYFLVEIEYLVYFCEPKNLPQS